ncbi:adhesion G protein-coupled receptor E3-like [Mytilus californianus]|uniref:adhesion G protein-coupled receptor E3-like n=1 Tax=Mytilus californianus TaxID=6549 RepID=UPI00224775D0|nr:adhesion G protein-coupled receptor E3-like [Mytilus californianus]
MMKGHLFLVFLLLFIQAFCTCARIILEDNFHADHTLVHGLNGRIRRETKDGFVDLRCTPGFTAFDDTCYKLVHDKLNWTQAKEECTKVNGITYHLVTIKSQAEQNFVNGIISSLSFNDTERVWIGLARHPSNLSIFFWMDGTNVSYDNWYTKKKSDDPFPDEPNNEDEKCGNVFMEQNKLGHWNDEKCELEYFYICEGTPDSVFCAAETDTYTFGSFNLTWNETNTGITACSSCPEGFNGLVSRKCKLEDKSGVWETSNVTDCKRQIFKNLIDQLDNINDGVQNVSIEEILRTFTHSLNNQSSFISGDINSGVIILEKSTVIFSTQSGNISLAETEAYMSATNSLLSSETATHLWQEVGDNNAAKVLNITSTFTSVVLKSLQNNSSLKISKPSLEVEINNKNEGDITFNALFDQSLGNDDRLFLAKESLKERTNTAGYIAIHYNTIAHLLPRKTSVNSQETTVVTSVLSLTIPGINQPTLNPPLHLYFTHTQTHVKGLRCSFWDFTLQNSGFWSTNGLKTVLTNSTFTECTSNHLTNFAVLLSLYEIPENHDEVLAVISKVGCSVSITALVLLLIIYYIEWRFLPSDKSKILVTMAVVFLLAYVVFLAGIEGTENKITCKVVAVVLHFLFLVGIHMMVAEGIVHGKMLATVLASTQQRSISPILLPIGFGIPVLIVAISTAVTKLDGYGDGKYCWLSTSNGLICTFTVPCAVVVLTNFVIFVFVVTKLFSIKAVKKKTKLQQLISGLRCFSVLAPIFGLSWSFGFFSLNEDTIVMSYLFVIINSFQGLLIFILHGLLDPKIQRSWKRKYSEFRKREKFSSTTTKSTEEINFDSITAAS